MKITVPAKLAIEGRFPALCVCHGEPADGWRQHDFPKQSPAWLKPIALVSFFAVGAIYAMVVRPLTVQIPFCRRCVADRRAARILVASAWLLLVVLFFGALAANSAALVLGWLIAMVAVVSLSFWWPAQAVAKGWVSQDGQTLHLTNADARFVTAMTANLVPSA